jgi:hypothetical protein
VRRLTRWYGANPLHLLALLACFALAGYAATQLVRSRPESVAIWFVGAVIGHDLVLMPLYSIADWSVLAAVRHRAPNLPAVPWINYLRVPAGLSALLLLVWFPLILRLKTHYQESTTLSPDPFLWHWLAVTGALFLLSATTYALRLRAARRAAARLGENGLPSLPFLGPHLVRPDPVGVVVAPKNWVLSDQQMVGARGKTELPQDPRGLRRDARRRVADLDVRIRMRAAG